MQWNELFRETISDIYVKDYPIILRFVRIVQTWTGSTPARTIQSRVNAG